jgi:hypothetical protein
MKDDQAVQEKHIPIVKKQKVSTDAGIECKTRKDKMTFFGSIGSFGSSVSL